MTTIVVLSSPTRLASSIWVRSAPQRRGEHAVAPRREPERLERERQLGGERVLGAGEEPAEVVAEAAGSGAGAASVAALLSFVATPLMLAAAQGDGSKRTFRSAASGATKASSRAPSARISSIASGGSEGAGLKRSMVSVATPSSSVISQ